VAILNKERERGQFQHMMDSFITTRILQRKGKDCQEERRISGQFDLASLTSEKVKKKRKKEEQHSHILILSVKGGWATGHSHNVSSYLGNDIHNTWCLISHANKLLRHQRKIIVGGKKNPKNKIAGARRDTSFRGGGG
jgi:hypothetical protein